VCCLHESGVGVGQQGLEQLGINTSPLHGQPGFVWPGLLPPRRLGPARGRGHPSLLHCLVAVQGRVHDRLVLAWVLQYASRHSQPGEHGHGAAAVDDDGDDDDEERGGQDHLPGLRPRVPDRQGEGDRTAETGEHHGVLDTAGDLDAPAEVQDGGEGVDVQEAAEEDGDEGTDDVVGVEVVLREGEHGDADVGEDKVLGHKVEEVEEALSGLLALLREVVVGVVGLGDATEQHRDDAGEFKDLRQEEGGVGHEDEEGALQ